MKMLLKIGKSATTVGNLQPDQLSFGLQLLNGTSEIMKKINSIIAITTFCLGAFSAHAQEGDQQMLTQEVDSGSGHQFALRILAPIYSEPRSENDPTPDPSPDTIIGGRMMLDDNMGIDVDVALLLSAADQDGLDLGISAALINYLSKSRVSTYYKAGVDLHLYGGDLSDGRDNEIGVFGGLGGEFFVIPEFSIFAEAGLAIPFAPDFEVKTYSTKAGIAYYF